MLNLPMTRITRPSLSPMITTGVRTNYPVWEKLFWKSTSMNKENIQPIDFRSALKPVKPVGQKTPEDNFQWQQIADSISAIEEQTKQTGTDVGQLWERSKNNNTSLQRLVEEIAGYSKEVTTEGNATKRDISELIAKLDESENKDVLEEIKNKLLVTIDVQAATISKQTMTISKQESIISDQSISIAKLEAKSGKLAMLETRYQDMAADYRQKYEEYQRLSHNMAELNASLGQLEQCHSKAATAQTVEIANIKSALDSSMD